MKYGKPALGNEDLLARWQAKGLLVEQPTDARRALAFVGYFRLRGYALPSMMNSPEGRKFKSGTTFDTVMARYEIDRELRRITLGQLERIEVAVRTVISNQMSFVHTTDASGTAVSRTAQRSIRKHLSTSRTRRVTTA